MKKRGQSQIVSTVLLILITVVAIGLIIGYVVPFVKNKLQEGDCLDVLGKVTVSSAYTCYNSTNSSTNVQVGIEDIRNLIEGFAVELGGPSSKTTKVVEGNPTGVRMYGGGSFEIPNSTEERTYIIDSINSKPEYIKVYPILSRGKNCGESDSINEIEDC